MNTVKKGNREFADYERAIVTGDWRNRTKEVGTVLGYDAATGKYWVSFRDGHGNGNSWHTADKMAHVPEWVRNGARAYSVTRWRAGQPFTITDAADEVVTLTAPDGFAFGIDIVDLLAEFCTQN